MSMVKGQCHCGQVQLKLKHMPAEMTECNCSICRRLAARWLFVEENDVEINYDIDEVGTYQWGDNDLCFYHCQKCGCSTHYVTTPQCDIDRVGVNANMLSPEDIKEIKIRKFNGAEM